MGFVLFFIGVLVNMCTGVNTRHHQTIETESSLQKNDSKIFPKTFDQPLKELRNVHEFLEIQLARNISNFTLNSLTKAGDNYNSMLQALEVKFIKVNNSTEVRTIDCSRVKLNLGITLYIQSELVIFIDRNSLISV